MKVIYTFSTVDFIGNKDTLFPELKIDGINKIYRIKTKNNLANPVNPVKLLAPNYFQ